VLHYTGRNTLGSSSEEFKWVQEDEGIMGYSESLNGRRIEIIFDKNSGLYTAYQRLSSVFDKLIPFPVEKCNNPELLKASIQEFLVNPIYDSFTHVYRRLELLDIFKKTFQKAIENNKPIVLIDLDIDGLRYILDNVGISAGEDVLITTASLILQNIGPSDVVGSYKGDEFLVLLPETKLKEAIYIAERIEEAARSYLFLMGKVFPFSISTGTASSEELDFYKPEKLLELADERMQIEKANKKTMRSQKL
jgi:diguanylate cyclase (GGDEF)-like protein